MDLATHFVVGVATGAQFGHPFLGGCIAAAPDLVLGITRRKAPTTAYNVTHSLAGMLAAAGAAGALWGWQACGLVYWCLLSHLVLDAPTHGEQWAPPLLYPYSDARFSFGQEWEFFNLPWLCGLWVSFLWIILVSSLPTVL